MYSVSLEYGNVTVKLLVTEPLDGWFVVTEKSKAIGPLILYPVSSLMQIFHRRVEG
jgi:hypothetical protein